MDSVIQKDIDGIITSYGHRLKHLGGKTVVITGANGVVGAYFVHTIARLNKTICKKQPITCICLTRHKVSTLSRLGYLLKNKNIQFKTVDVTVKIPTIAHVDYIIHCASYGSPKAYLSKPIATMESNSTGTKLLLDISKEKHVKNIMFISTGSVYGDARKNEESFTEEHSGYVSPLEPRAIYSESKRYGETLCMVYARYFNVHTTVARLSNMFGPGFSLDDGRAIPDFFNQAFEKQKIEINGDLATIRAYVYIADAIEGMFRILLDGKKGEVYNVANEKGRKIKEIAENICAFYKDCSVVAKENKNRSYLKGSAATVVVSAKKIKKELGWKEQTTLNEGLKRLYSWYSNVKNNERIKNYKSKTI